MSAEVIIIGLIVTGCGAIVAAWLPAILLVRRMALDAEAEVRRRASHPGKDAAE